MSSVHPRGTLTNDKNKIYDDAADMRRPNPNGPLIPLHSAMVMNRVTSGWQVGQTPGLKPRKGAGCITP